MNRFLLVGVLGAALSQLQCGGVTCGPGTEQKVDPVTGNAICAPAAAVPSTNCGANTTSTAGECLAPDPMSFCGDGTKWDDSAKMCVPKAGGNGCLPPPCPADAATICLNGCVSFIENLMPTAGTPLEVRAYTNPIPLLTGMMLPQPDKIVTTDEKGAFVVDGLTDMGHLGIIALTVADVGGANKYIYSGSALNMLSAGKTARLDLVAIQLSTVQAWDTAAGYTSETFEGDGAYLARFFDVNGMPVPGVQLELGGVVAPNTFYFSGNYATLDKNAMMTDATGGGINRVVPGRGVAALGDMYTGMGGGKTWPSLQGTSRPGVIFVQPFIAR
jgi:hypothetical protein